jgi:hypothetical protein
MKISIIFFFIISFFSLISASPRTIFCNGVKNGCYRGCSHKGGSAMTSCRRQCERNYEVCLKSVPEA